MALTALIFLCLIPLSCSKYFGSIKIDGFGEAHLVGKIRMGRYLDIVDDTTFSLNGGGRIYFANSPTDDTTPNMYLKIPLINKHLSFKVDVSQVGCGCNAAAYMVQMPAASEGYARDYYCDSNFVNGNFCPEYDLFEGNKHTMSSVIHTCTGGPDYWSHCDGSGCSQNAFAYNPHLMCPNSNCTINTTKPFKVTYYQNQTIVNVKFEQEGRSNEFNVCSGNAQYLSEMSASLNSMTFVASLWGGSGIDMSWLDGKTGCTDECYLPASTVTFSEFKLW